MAECQIPITCDPVKRAALAGSVSAENWMITAAAKTRFGRFARKHGRRRRWVVAGTLLLIAVAALASLVTRQTTYVRNSVVTALNSRFQSEVNMASLQVNVFPRPGVAGADLSLRHNGRKDVSPLVRVGSFSASAGLAGLFRSPLRLRTVELDRMEISIPPGGVGDGPRTPDSATGSHTVTPGAPRHASDRSRLVIEQLISREARLEIVPRERGKLPRVFEIHDLVMHGLGDGGGATFQAAVTNPKPRGRITTHGTFGPWQSNDPRTTPISGQYVFKDADLDTIKGIHGTLSSIGAYSGVLERIEVTGVTDTPDFAVDLAAQPVHLTTRFQAVVNGTNGNTSLKQVEARLLETIIVAQGAVERGEDVKGRRTTLDVTIENGRIEDLLKLAVKSETPSMTGRVQLETKFLLPAGDQDVIDKLELDGAFRLDEARFTHVNVQQQINTLSRRGQGDAGNDGPSVVSNLSGRFILRNAILKFADVTFAVPGAVVQLAGTFDLNGDTLDFAGNLLLDATLSETTTGIKSLLARAAQPFFRRPGGGSKLPIRISGPRAKPKFGLDVKRALTPGA